MGAHVAPALLSVVLRHASVVSLEPITHSWRGDVRRRDGGKRSRFASRGDGRKNRAPLAVLAQPRRSACVAASAHEGAASRATPPTGRIPPDRRDISLRAVFRAIENGPSLRLAARDLLPPSGDAPVTRRDERTGQVAAAGRWTRHAPATDGNRVCKRSGHAAPDSTMALGLAVSRDDCGLSPGSPQAACASSAPALEDTVAMPAVPGPRTRLARCGFTRRRACVACTAGSGLTARVRV